MQDTVTSQMRDLPARHYYYYYSRRNVTRFADDFCSGGFVFFGAPSIIHACRRRSIADLGEFVGVRLERHLVAVVRPRAEDERAFLLVERKVLHVDGTRTFVDCARHPHDVTRIENQHIRLKLNLEFPVGAAHVTTSSQ